jgi:hypothetical protein
MRKLQLKQHKVNLSTSLLLKGITPFLEVNLGWESSLWKYNEP